MHELLNIVDWVFRPSEGLSTRARQYMYVNGRPMAHDPASGLLNRLHQQVAKDMQTRGAPAAQAARQHPAFVCQVSCPPALYDVTAQPDKRAVVFADWALVLAAVRAAALQAWKPMVPAGMLPYPGPEPSNQPPCEPGQQQPRAVAPEGGCSVGTMLEEERCAGGSTGSGRKRVRCAPLERGGEALDETGASRKRAGSFHEAEKPSKAQTSGLGQARPDLRSMPVRPDTHKRGLACQAQEQHRKVQDRPSSGRQVLSVGDTATAGPLEQACLGYHVRRRAAGPEHGERNLGPPHVHGSREQRDAPCQAAATGCRGAGAEEDPPQAGSHAEEARLALPHSPLLAAEPGGAEPTRQQLDPHLCWPQSPTVSCWLQSRAASAGSPIAHPDEAECPPWSLEPEDMPDVLALPDWLGVDRQRASTGLPPWSGLREAADVQPPGRLPQRPSSTAQLDAAPQGCLAIPAHKLGQQEAASLLEACRSISCPSGRRGRQRAASAEPQPERRRRAAHTNPLSSLRSSGGVSPSWGEPLQQVSGALPGGDAADRYWSAGAPVQGRLGAATVSGVCGLLSGGMQPDAPRNRRKVPCAQAFPPAEALQHPPADLPEAPTAVDDQQRCAEMRGAQAGAGPAAVNQDGRCQEPQQPGLPIAALRAADLAAAPARRGKRREPHRAAGRGHPQAGGVLDGGATAAEPVPASGVGEVSPLALPVGISGNAVVAGEGAAAAGTALGEALCGEGALAELLRGWTNPAPAPQHPVPDLAALACGNTLGLVPRALSRDLLDSARPLQQVPNCLRPCCAQAPQAAVCCKTP